jgi:GNAT superfamily N-acetyltransferase
MRYRARTVTESMSVTVRRVRAGEWSELKAVRLAALQDEPSAFGSTYAAEVAQDDDHWVRRASLAEAGVESVTFFAVTGEEVVGLAAGYRPDPSRPAVELVSMWVEPAARRAGVARALVDAVVGWARDAGAVWVELWVTRGNTAAASLYRAAGFRETGDHQPLPSDPCRDEIRMRLSLA